MVLRLPAVILVVTLFQALPAHRALQANKEPLVIKAQTVLLEHQVQLVHLGLTER